MKVKVEGTYNNSNQFICPEPFQSPREVTALLNSFHFQSQIKSKNAMETWGLSYVTPSIVVLIPTSAYLLPVIAIGTKWQGQFF